MGGQGPFILTKPFQAVSNGARCLLGAREVQHKISEQYYACKVLHKASGGSALIWLQSYSPASLTKGSGTPKGAPSRRNSWGSLHLNLQGSTMLSFFFDLPSNESQPSKSATLFGRPSLKALLRRIISFKPRPWCFVDTFALCTVLVKG